MARHRGATIMCTKYGNIARDWVLKDDKSDSQKNNTTMMSSINQNYTTDTVIILCQKGIASEQWNAAEVFFLHLGMEGWNKSLGCQLNERVNNSFVWWRGEGMREGKRQRFFEEGVQMVIRWGWESECGTVLWHHLGAHTPYATRPDNLPHTHLHTLTHTPVCELTHV